MTLAEGKHTSNKKMILLLGLLFCSPMAMTTVEAEIVRLGDLHGNYNLKRSNGTRIDQHRNRKCPDCVANIENEKLEYLKRVVIEHSSKEYQKLIESQIFADSKFVNGCWKNAIDKGMEFFFTVSEIGVASDFAWFPKKRAGKCIKRHISSITFPELTKPHHSWLLATGQEY